MILPIAVRQSAGEQFDGEPSCRKDRPSQYALTPSLREALAIPVLPAGSVTRRNGMIRGCPRGMLHLGPAFMPDDDPFGLLVRRRTVSNGICIPVHPVTVAITLPVWEAAREPDGTPSGISACDGDDFHALREYRSDDDMRGIHWPSTAKTGMLIVRQYAAECRAGGVVSIDTTPGGYRDTDEFELAVSVFASIGKAYLDAGRPLIARTGTATFMPESAVALLDACCGIVLAEHYAVQDGRRQRPGRHRAGNGNRAGDDGRTPGGVHPGAVTDTIRPSPYMARTVSDEFRTTEHEMRIMARAEVWYHVVGSHSPFDGHGTGLEESWRMDGRRRVTIQVDHKAQASLRCEEASTMLRIGDLADLPRLLEVMS
ncbi:DUF58 domain-containing protein [Bifidobacterium sp. SO1]|nr:DUF58 domain-containing protein [Bifidobacterium sp. SO1]MBT1161535.1 DUF58 domain-containing protein [Bifidobacterium sp. SO1]